MTLRRTLWIASLALTARADLTLRYRFELQASGIAAAQLKEMLPGEMQGGITYGYKDDGRQYVRAMEAVVLISADGKETILFPALKIYTKPGAAEPENERRQLESLGAAIQDAAPKIESRSTGRTKKIQNIACEERLMTLSLDRNKGEELSLTAWLPLEKEAQRVPALRRLRAEHRGSRTRFDPLSDVVKAFASNPQGAAKMTALFQEFEKLEGAFELRVKVPDAGGIEIVVLVDALHEDAIPEELLTIPADYRLVTEPELRRALEEAARATGPVKP